METQTEQKPDTAARKFDFIDFYDYCVKQHGESEAMQILEAVEYAAEAERRRAQLQMSRQERMREAVGYLSEVWTVGAAA